VELYLVIIQNIKGIPISISIALMSFVGTEMGKGDVKKAKIYVVIGLLIYALTTAICSILLWVLREPLATFFTSSDHEEYSNKAREIFIDAIPWLIGGMIIVDGL
jgi:MATE family multidrug resistance protein